jgi:hypothetical protein
MQRAGTRLHCHIYSVHSIVSKAFSQPELAHHMTFKRRTLLTLLRHITFAGLIVSTSPWPVGGG